VPENNSGPGREKTPHFNRLKQTKEKKQRKKRKKQRVLRGEKIWSYGIFWQTKQAKNIRKKEGEKRTPRPQGEAGGELAKKDPCLGGEKLIRVTSLSNN